MKAAKDLKQVTNYAVMKEYISNNRSNFSKLVSKRLTAST